MKLPEIIKQTEDLLEINIESDTSNSIYRVKAQKNPKEINCNCLGFINHKICKHLKYCKSLIDSFYNNTPKFEKVVDVQYYDHIEGELKQSQEHKASKFIEHNCIEYNAETKCFLCKPIPGYNKRTYLLKPTEGKFNCNCQGFKKKEKDDGQGFCSHVWALMLYLRKD